MNLFGKDEAEALRPHLVGLICGNARLQREQVFFVNPISLRKDLAPAVLARRLHSERGEPQSREG